MRVRLRYTKAGKVRWTSHRDLARMFERAFRRTQLPIAYSGGFAPRPKVSFGLALPTGAESEAEYLDVELVEGTTADVNRADLNGVDLATLPARLSEALPVGVDVNAAAVIDDAAPSLQEAVSSCVWRLEVAGTGHDELCEKVADVIAAPTLVVTRTRKGNLVTDDIRPGILALRVVEGVEVECELATQPRAVRPGELVRAIDPGLEEAWVRRTNQWIERDGARGVPLHATDAQHVRLAGARAL
jgi:radical SAM-linked protein